MRYEARVAIYDVLDMVWVSCDVWDSADLTDGKVNHCLRLSTTLQGQGESDPREWLRDALVVLAEMC